MASTTATENTTDTNRRRPGDTRAVVIGGASILMSAIFFLVPFLFIFLIASKDVT